MKVPLKGIHKVTANGTTYYYAWRGGPRMSGKPGTDEFVASWHEAQQGRKKPQDGRLFRALVIEYRASSAYGELADTTRRNWSPWLDRISAYFGTLSVAQFDRADKIGPVIRKWHTRWSETPRTADYALQVLSRVLSFGVATGRLVTNACNGIGHLYAGNRAAIIWAPEDIARLKAKASPEIAAAVDLAAYSGLRLGDLIRLAWSHVEDDAIVVPTSKSRHKREAVIPLYDELRALLSTLPKVASTVLVNSRGRPWTVDGFGSSFNKAKWDAGLGGQNIHFHDLRGTAATNFYLAGLEERVIAEMLGWSEEQVRRILRRYVNRHAAIQETIKRLRDKRLVDASPNVVPLPTRSHLPSRGVYFVLDGDRVKIGWSSSIRGRLSALQTGAAGQLSLVHAVAGERADERRFHEMFAAQRIRGEWFRFEGQLATFLGTFIKAAENEG